jgi:hypothetical protein
MQEFSGVLEWKVQLGKRCCRWERAVKVGVQKTDLAGIVGSL